MERRCETCGRVVEGESGFMGICVYPLPNSPYWIDGRALSLAVRLKDGTKCKAWISVVKPNEG